MAQGLLCFGFYILTPTAGFAADLAYPSLQEKAAIAEAVKGNLQHPQSAQFKWLPIRRDIRLYCGLVQADGVHDWRDGYAPFVVMVFREKGAVQRVVDFSICTDPSTVEPTIRVCEGRGFTAWEIAQ